MLGKYQKYESFLPGHIYMRDPIHGDQLMFQRQPPTGGWGKLYLADELETPLETKMRRQVVYVMLVTALAFLVLAFFPREWL